MKRTLYFLSSLALVFSLLCCNSTDKNNKPGIATTEKGSPEEMAEKIINQLRLEDYGALEKMLLTREQASLAIDNTFHHDSIKEKMRSRLDTDFVRINRNARKCYEEVTEKLRKDTIVLKNIVYKSCDYKILKTKGMYLLDLFINFECSGKPHVLASRKLVKADNEWVFTGDLVYGLRPGAGTGAPGERMILDEQKKAKVDSIIQKIKSSRGKK